MVEGQAGCLLHLLVLGVQKRYKRFNSVVLPEGDTILIPVAAPTRGMRHWNGVTAVLVCTQIDMQYAVGSHTLYDRMSPCNTRMIVHSH